MLSFLPNCKHVKQNKIRNFSMNNLIYYEISLVPMSLSNSPLLLPCARQFKTWSIVIYYANFTLDKRGREEDFGKAFRLYMSEFQTLTCTWRLWKIQNYISNINRPLSFMYMFSASSHLIWWCRTYPFPDLLFTSGELDVAHAHKLYSCYKTTTSVADGGSCRNYKIFIFLPFLQQLCLTHHKINTAGGLVGAAERSIYQNNAFFLSPPSLKKMNSVSKKEAASPQDSSLVDPHAEVRKLQELVKKLELQNELLRSKQKLNNGDVDSKISHNGSASINNHQNQNNSCNNNNNNVHQVSDDDVDILDVNSLSSSKDDEYSW